MLPYETQEEIEKRMDAEVKKVVYLMTQDGFKGASDWNVISDDVVHILDANDNILGTITCNQLTKYWNLMEGVVFV